VVSRTITDIVATAGVWTLNTKIKMERRSAMASVLRLPGWATSSATQTITTAVVTGTMATAVI